VTRGKEFREVSEQLRAGRIPKHRDRRYDFDLGGLRRADLKTRICASRILHVRIVTTTREKAADKSVGATAANLTLAGASITLVHSHFTQ